MLLLPFGSTSNDAGSTLRPANYRYASQPRRELDDPHEAAPILKEYLSITGPPRRYFSAKLDDPVEQFAAEASAHPVFELLPVG